jgi:two-component system, cell cycle response regulator DivK
VAWRGVHRRAAGTTIALPSASTLHVVTSGSSIPRTISAAEAATRHGMKRILVVEDDADTREIYSTILRHRGYDVMVAPDGSHGIEAARASVPDLILMNLSMPRLDGLSATSLLRKDPRTAGIPIIACTGYIVEDGGEDAEDAGCDAYIEKPCEPTRLLQEVERFIGPPISAV